MTGLDTFDLFHDDQGRPGYFWPEGEGLTPITTEEDLARAWGVERHVGLTRIGWGRRSVAVSTVHLILDHGFQWDKSVPYVPVLWETMCFAETAHPDLDGYTEDGHFTYPFVEVQDRWTSYTEAHGGHTLMVKVIVATLVAQGHTVVTRDLLAHGEPYNPTGRGGRDRAGRKKLRELAAEMAERMNAHPETGILNGTYRLTGGSATAGFYQQ